MKKFKVFILILSTIYFCQPIFAKELTSLDYFNIGKKYYWEGNLNLAIQNFEKAKTLEPNAYEIYNELGITYCDAGKYDIGIKCLKKALTLHPNDARIYRNLGVAYNKSSNSDLAIENCQKAIELEPNLLMLISTLDYLIDTMNNTI